jgi:hypothetical protein
VGFNCRCGDPGGFISFCRRRWTMCPWLAMRVGSAPRGGRSSVEAMSFEDHLAWRAKAVTSLLVPYRPHRIYPASVTFRYPAYLTDCSNLTCHEGRQPVGSEVSTARARSATYQPARETMPQATRCPSRLVRRAVRQTSRDNLCRRCRCGCYWDRRRVPTKHHCNPRYVQKQ